MTGTDFSPGILSADLTETKDPMGSLKGKEGRTGKGGEELYVPHGTVSTIHGQVHNKAQISV